MPQTMEAPVKQATTPATEALPPKTETALKVDALITQVESDLENEIYPNRKRITRTMCEALANNGLLDERYELIDGVIIFKMPVHPPHRIALILLRNWLIVLFGLPFAQTEDPIALPGAEGEITEPQPDIAVTLAPTTEYIESNPSPQDIALLVEIADSSLNFDINTKARLYARMGIPEYWVMDVKNRRLHRHRQPTETGYQDIVILYETDSVSPLNHAEAVLISALLPAPRPVSEP